MIIYVLCVSCFVSVSLCDCTSAIMSVDLFCLCIYFFMSGSLTVCLYLGVTVEMFNWILVD